MQLYFIIKRMYKSISDFKFFLRRTLIQINAYQRIVK